MEEQEQNSTSKKKSLSETYDKYYKLLLLIPLALLIFSFIYMGFFYSANHDFIYKDVSLTGGTSATISGAIDIPKLNEVLTGKLIDFNTRDISDLITGEQKAVIVETKSSPEETKKILEEYLGYELTSENSSFEFTGASLSQSFYLQLILAIIFAFTFMGVVIFFLFGEKFSQKIILLIVSLIVPVLFLSKVLSINTSLISALVIFLATMFFYIKGNMPSFAVKISAFADILMTLVVVNLFGMKLSSAGIIAFLLLIGYSVDTDILLTNRVLKRHGPVNEKIFGAFKTGITMALTSLLAVLSALFVVRTFSSTLTQIFTILSIGLMFDILNTWLTNASLIKWYVEKTGK